MPAYDKRVKVVTDGEDEKVLVVNQDIVTTSPASGDLLVFENGAWGVRHLAAADMPSAMATDAEVTAAVAAEAALRDAALPWLIDIDYAMTPTDNTGWNSYVADAQSLTGGFVYSTGGDASIRHHDLGMAAGTWKAEVLYLGDVGYGTMAVKLDGVSKGTIDSSAGSATYNLRGSVTGIVVATSGKHRVSLGVTGGTGVLQGIRLIRTA